MNVGGSKLKDLRRGLGVALIAVLFLVISVPAVKFTLGQAYYQQGVSLSEKSNYSQAIEKLTKAAVWQPNNAAIHHQLGLVHLRMVPHLHGFTKATMAARAAEYLQQARNLNPLEPEMAYGLARSLELLGNNRKEQALDAYRQAISLYPNNPLYHRTYANELYSQGKEEELFSTVKTLGRTYPGSYGFLARQPYWSASLQAGFQQGLKEAIEEGIDTRKALAALAAIHAGEDNWSEAAAQYEAALSIEEHLNTHRDFYRLATYQLNSGDSPAAAASFIRGFAGSSSREQDLVRLYRIFQGSREPQGFLLLYKQLSTQFALSDRFDIRMAELMIAGHQFAAAEEILINVTNAKEYLAEPWFLLAGIAELQGDWDRMERFSHKAVTRSPENSNYRYRFSQSLGRQQKYSEAEKEADQALQYSHQPGDPLYNYRAQLRWKQNDYQGALEDWQQANKLNPGNASYYAWIGRAHKKLGNDKLAVIAYSEALNRDPSNVNYKKELQGSSF